MKLVLEVLALDDEVHARVPGFRVQGFGFWVQSLGEKPATQCRMTHPRPFVGVSQKSIFDRPCQVLAINALKMAPRTG